MNFSPLFTVDPAPMLAAAAVFVVAGLVKGIVGLGLPTIAMALLTLSMSPTHAAALLIVPSLVTNLRQLAPLDRLWPIARRLAAMQVGIVVGTLGGAWWLGAPAGAWAATALGIALAAYAAWGLFGRAASIGPSNERRVGPLVGLATGLVTAATGVFVVPAVPFLQSLSLERDELVQAMAVSFTVSTVALAAGLWTHAGLSPASLVSSVAMVVPALAGMGLGTRLRRLLSPAAFRRCFLVFLMIFGVATVIHATS